jgi:small-conductance mechanosensitive channel
MNNATAPLAESPWAEELRLVGADIFNWVTSHSFQILVGVVIAAIIVGIIASLKGVGLRICRTDPERGQWRTIIARALSKTRLWFMVAVAAELVVGYARAPDVIASTIQFLFTIAVTLQGAIWAREIILGLIEQRAGTDIEHNSLVNAVGVLRVLVTIAIFIFAVVIILDNVGVNVTGLVAGLGIGGIAIGLAAQGIFRDLFAALSILFDKPFRIGQTITSGDATGKVEAIGLRSTRLRSVDGELVILANAKLLDQQIRNMTNVQERRVIHTLQLSYRNDPDALAVIPEEVKKLVEAEKGCRFDHAWLIDFDITAIKLEILYHFTHADAERLNKARHRILIALLRRFDEMGLEVTQTAPPAPPPPLPNRGGKPRSASSL